VTRNSSIFALWPYAAFALLVLGTILRYLLALRQPGVLPTKVAEARSVFTGRIWWLSVLTLLAGHLAGLLLPRAILSWNARPGRLYLLEGVALTAGLAALISGAALVWRHLGRPSRSVVTEAFDMGFLALALVVVVSGLLVAVVHRWGSSWGVITLTPYVGSLLRGDPAPELAAQMPFLVRLHILATFAALAVVPFTRLATFPLLVLYQGQVLLSQTIRTAGRAINSWLSKHNPSARFWPEED
jgi:nitrate reductase gamma subunit